jgi:signal transduction histidine kinase/DNA-binding response OmpR family regulator
VGEVPTNILVVDDLPEKLLAYRTILDELGQNIITAVSGEEALKAVLRNDFAVILLDVQMPGMGGMETASLIRKRKRSAHTPIIFLTAFADEVRAAEGYAQGAVDYITTPVVPSVLRAKVRVFCDLYRMSQIVRKQADERIALVEERTRREAAEEANRRLAFSARTGTILGQSLDQDVTAQEVARLPLNFLADEVVLVFVSRGGSWKTIVVRDSDSGPMLMEGEGREFVPVHLLAGIDSTLDGDAPTPVPDEATFIAPLRAHGKVFGAIALSRESSGRGFGASDLTLAEAYATRAAIALDNARLYREVQEADRQKNEFLSMLAHELRNPLAPIRNANEILRQKGSDITRVKWAQGVIDRQLTHLVRLVDDLLDVSRLTQGKIRLAVERVGLRAVVEQAVEAARPVVDHLGHALEVELPRESVELTADRARLTQVLTNLLNNAAKYTDPGGRICLSAQVVTDAGKEASALEINDRMVGSALHAALRAPLCGHVEIRVRDTGVGIAPDLLPFVFDLFTQASRSLDRSQGGLGIGLTLVRRLVEMHGGTVSAQSEGLGKGAEFIIRLPLPAPATTSTSGTAVDDDEPEPTEKGGTLRIVVVDDNIDGAETLANLLELLGHDVRVSHDGPSGIVAVREFGPDIVLLDIGLPGMDGFEVARRLRSELSECPTLVAVSGYGREEDRKQARDAGFEHHYVKPVDLNMLRALLEAEGAVKHV